MELQELYTSFLPRKAKNEARQPPAPSQIYLSSNMQKLKLIKMEKERKKSQAADIQEQTKNHNDYQTKYQGTIDKKNDDFKRSKSFNQSPIKKMEQSEIYHSRNPSIPFEQYVSMQIMNRSKQQGDENQSGLFQNSLLSQINNKDKKQLMQLQPSSQNEKSSTNRQSALNSRNLYQQSIVILDQSGVSTKRNDLPQHPQNFSQVVDMQSKSIHPNENLDLSYQFALENNLIKDSVDYSVYQREVQDYKQFERKCRDQREKSPMNVYFQQYNLNHSSHHYDKYYPHYITKLEIPQDVKPERRLEEVMGGKMRSYLPSELRNLDNDQKRQYHVRENNDVHLAQRFIVNSKIMENNGQYNTYQPDANLDNMQTYTHQMGIGQQTPGSRQQKRGKSSISTSRPTQLSNIPQPISTKVIKPPLSIQAHQNRENVIVQQNVHETTVHGEKQAYIIPLQQNYSVCLNEIDRIKARRKLLIKRGISSNGDLQPFSQEDSKQHFLSKIEQSRSTPKNQYEFESSTQQKSISLKNQKPLIPNNNDSFISATLDSNHQLQRQQNKKLSRVDFQSYVKEINQSLINNTKNTQRQHIKSQV